MQDICVFGCMHPLGSLLLPSIHSESQEKYIHFQSAPICDVLSANILSQRGCQIVYHR